MIRIKANLKRVLIALFAVLCLFLVWAGIKIQPKEKQAEAVTSADVVHFGIDISHHQGTVNFTTMKNSKAEFVILRLGYSTTLDTKFASYLQSVQSVGIPFGIYIYSLADTTAEAVAEANWTVTKLNSYGLNNGVMEYPVFFDYEESTISSRTKATNTAIINAYLNTVKNAGYYPSLYMGGALMNSAINISDVAGDIWVASYGSTWSGFNSKYYNSKVTMWQFETGEFGNKTGDSLSGYSYGVSSQYIDQNYCFVDYPTIIKNSGLNGFGEQLESKGEGVSLSANDGDVNFETMKTSATELDFALVTLGNATNQTIDAKFAQNMAGLKTVGKSRGVVVNSRAATAEAATAEAAWVVENLKKMDVGQIDFPIVYNYSFAVTDATTATAIVNAFSAEMSRNNARAMLLTNGSNFNNSIDKDALACDVYLMWWSSSVLGDVSRLSSSRYYHSSVKMWQYSDGNATYGCKFTAAQVGSSAATVSQIHTLVDYPAQLKGEQVNFFEKYSYNVSVTQTNGGTVSTSSTAAKAGTQVTVTATPDKGAELLSISVNGEVISGNTFTMPEEDVTVTANFQVNISIVGMSIRTAANDGLRFVVKVKETQLDVYGADAKYGVMLMPQSMDSVNDWTVSHDGSKYTANNSNVLVIERGVWWSEELCQENGIEEGYAVYSCALIGNNGAFPEAMYNKPITAVAFVIPETGETVYTDKAVRSIGYVAMVESMKPNYVSNATVDKISNKTEIEFSVNSANKLNHTEKAKPDLLIGGMPATESSIVNVTYTTDNDKAVSIVGDQLKGVGNGNAMITATVQVANGASFTKNIEVVGYGKPFVDKTNSAYSNDFESVTSFTSSSQCNAVGSAGEIITEGAINGNKSLKLTTSENGKNAEWNIMMTSDFGVKAGVKYAVSMDMYVSKLSKTAVGYLAFRLIGTADVEGLYLKFDNGKVTRQDADLEEAGATYNYDAMTDWAYDAETGLLSVVVYMTAVADNQQFYLMTVECDEWTIIIDDFVVVAGNYYEQGFENETTFVASDAFKNVGSTGSLVTGSNAISGNVSVKFTTTSAGATAQWNTIMTSTLGSVSNGTTYRVSMKMKVTPPSQNAYLAFRLIGGTDVEGLYLKFNTDGTITQQDKDLEATSGNYAYDSKTNWSYDKTTGILTVNVYMKAVADGQQFYLMTLPETGTAGGTWTIIADDVSFGKM